MRDFKHKFAYFSKILLLICISHQLVQALRTRRGAYVNELWTRNLEVRERTSSSIYEIVNENYQEVKIGTGSITSFPYEAHYKNALSFGFTFAVNAIKTIELTEIVTYVGGFNGPKELDYEVYRIYGGFSEDNIDGSEPWTLITSGKQTTSETLNIELLDCVIPQGNVMKIYITLKTENLVYSATESNLFTKLGQPYEQNSHISLLTGAAVSAYPLQDQTELIHPRYWRGSINYNIYDAHTLTPSASPSGEPTRITEAPSIQPFTSLIFPSLSPSAPPRIHSMTPSLHPSSKPSLFIQYLSSNQTFSFLGHDIEFMNMKNDNDFCLQVNITLNDFFHNDTDITITSVDTHEETLYTSNYNEITATITAKYSSTHDIDFSSKVQYAITESRQIILDNLSKHSNYFKDVERIGSITTPTKFYDYKSTSEKTSISFFGPGLYEMNIQQLIEFENIVTKYLSQCLASSDATPIIVMSKVHEQIFNNQNYPYLITRLFILGKYLPTTKFDFVSAILSSMKECNETLPSLLKESNLPNFQHITSIDVGTEVIVGEVLSDNINHNATKNSAASSVVAYVAVSIGVCLLLAFISAYIYFICRKGRRRKEVQNIPNEVSYDLKDYDSKIFSIMCLRKSSRHKMHDSSRHSKSRPGSSRRRESKTSIESLNNSKHGLPCDDMNGKYEGNTSKNKFETNIKKKIRNSRSYSSNLDELDKQIRQPSVDDRRRSSDSNVTYEIGRGTYHGPIFDGPGKSSGRRSSFSSKADPPQERRSSFSSKIRGFESLPESSMHDESRRSSFSSKRKGRRSSFSESLPVSSMHDSTKQGSRRRRNPPTRNSEGIRRRVSSCEDIPSLAENDCNNNSGIRRRVSSCEDLPSMVQNENKNNSGLRRGATSGENLPIMAQNDNRAGFGKRVMSRENIPNMYHDKINNKSGANRRPHINVGIVPNTIHCEDNMAQNENENNSGFRRRVLSCDDICEILEDEISNHSNRHRRQRPIW